MVKLSILTDKYLDRRQHFYSMDQEEIEVKWCIMELDSWDLPIHLMSQNNESNKQCFFYAFIHHFDLSIETNVSLLYPYAIRPV